MSDDHYTKITADEINCLIYSYFTDSGFTHTAFTFQSEARLNLSPHFSKHIRRGELVELLVKSLLYMEVESHWKQDALTLGCQVGFSLLEPHVCSLEPPAETGPSKATGSSLDAETQPVTSGSSSRLETNGKRKSATPPTENGHVDKRARIDDSRAEQASTTSSSNTAPMDTVTRSGDKGSPTSLAASTSRNLGKGKGKVINKNAVQILGGHESQIFVAAWHPKNPNILASGSRDAVVNIYDVSTPETTEKPLRLDQFQGELRDLTAVAWNPAGDLLAIASYDCKLRVYTITGEEYFVAGNSQMGPIFAAQFNESGKWLATASLDGGVTIWDVEQKKLHHAYKYHSDCCLDVEWIDERTWASCGADNRIYLSRLDYKASLGEFYGHKDEVNSIKRNASATRLASGSDDRTARIWDITPIVNREVTPINYVPKDFDCVVLVGHKHSVTTIAWCPQTLTGTELIATSSFDATARVWDSYTGACLRVFAEQEKPVYAISFSPDADLFATGSGEGFLHIYKVANWDKTWSWKNEAEENPAIFELLWKKTGDIERLAMPLQSQAIGLIETSAIPELR